MTCKYPLHALLACVAQSWKRRTFTTIIPKSDQAFRNGFSSVLTIFQKPGHCDPRTNLSLVVIRKKTTSAASLRLAAVCPHSCLVRSRTPALPRALVDVRDLSERPFPNRFSSLAAGRAHAGRTSLLLIGKGSRWFTQAVGSFCRRIRPRCQHVGARNSDHGASAILLQTTSK